MLGIKIAYFPIGRKTFDMETAGQYFRQSLEFLKNDAGVVYAPGDILTSIDELGEFAGTIPGDQDLIVFQMLTFADAEFIVKVITTFPQPVLVWSVREPEVGGRLRLNSLTGGNSTSHALRSHNREFDFLLGNPDEDKTGRKIRAMFKARQAANQLKKLKVGVVGDHPAGFFFSGVDETELIRATGVRVQKLDLYDLFRKSAEAPEEQWKPMLEKAASKVVGLRRDEESVVKFAKFSSTLKKYLDEQGVRATAIRCWPDFFTELGAAACSTLSQFIEDGLVASCEADIHGSITMYIQRELSSGSPPYLGDLVHLSEESNSVVFWHCGAGAYSLAHPSTGAQAGVHPNRKMGFTMEFGLKPGKVTVSRLSKSSDGYRMLIMRGEALDSPQRFNGTTVEVGFNGNAADIVQSLMLEGFEPHYSIVYDDIVDELKELSRLLGIKAVIYE